MNQKTVSFDGHGLKLDTAEDAEKICSHLEDADYEVLILQGNSIGTEAAERISHELSRASNLKEAHFKDIFTSRGKDELPDALNHLLQGIVRSGARLVHLDLSDNAIGPVGAPPVLEFLRSKSAQDIERFYVNNCGWGPDGSSSLANVLGHLKNLTEFICGRSRLEVVGAKAITKSLAHINTLKVLKLNQNGINPTGILHIANLIKNNRASLKIIDLSDNIIKEEGAKALADVLIFLSELSELYLNDSLLSNKGFMTICEALQNASYLREMKNISFEGNELSGQKVIDAIFSIFRECDSEFTLNLLENDFTSEELRRLENSGLNILVDDIEEDDSDYNEDGKEEGEVDKFDDNNSEIESKDQYFDHQSELGYLSEAISELISETKKPLKNDQSVKEAFNIMISSHLDTKSSIQVYGEEFGLMKVETTGKCKPLAREALVYIGSRLNELPVEIREFLELVISKDTQKSLGWHAVQVPLYPNGNSLFQFRLG